MVDFESDKHSDFFHVVLEMDDDNVEYNKSLSMTMPNMMESDGLDGRHSISDGKLAKVTEEVAYLMGEEIVGVQWE